MHLPVFSFSLINPVPPEIIETHINLVAKRKLNVILRSRATPTKSFNVGNLVQVYYKHEKAKCGAWSSPHLFLSVNNLAEFVKVPGRSSHSRNVAFEDVRLAQDEDIFRHAVQLAIAGIDDSYSDSLECIAVKDDSDTSEPDRRSFNMRRDLQTKASLMA